MSTYFKKYNLLFYGLNFTYYSVSCAYFGFLIRYLSSYGYSAFACGVMNMLMAMMSLLLQPLVGYITDTYLTAKKCILISDLVCMALVFVLPLTISLPVIPVLGAVLMQAFFGPATYLCDTWSIAMRERFAYIDYGKNRSGGSLGYAVVAAICGHLIARFGYLSLFVMAFAMLFLNLLMLLSIPEVPCSNTRKQSDASKQSGLSFPQVCLILWKNKAYMLFLLTSAFYSISMRALATYATYKVSDMGGGDAELGIALAIGAVFEVPLLLVMSTLMKRFRLHTLYALALFWMFMRNLLFATVTQFGLFYVAQAMQAFSYGTFVAVSLELINRMVPSEIRSTGVTVMVSLNNGLVAILTGLVGGWIVDQAGVVALSWIVFVFMSISLAVELFVSVKTALTKPEELI